MDKASINIVINLPTFVYELLKTYATNKQRTVEVEIEYRILASLEKEIPVKPIERLKYWLKKMKSKNNT